MERKGGRHSSHRLVLVPFPFLGHITPMLQLATILHSKGFSITVAHTQFNSPDSSSHPDFNFLPLSDGSTSTPKVSDDFIAFISYVNSSCRGPLEEVLTRIVEEQNQLGEFPCIIYDGLMSFAETVARQLKLPSIILRTSSAANFSTYYAYPRLQEEGQLPFKDFTLQEVVPRLYPLRFKDLPISDFKNVEGLLQATAAVRDIGTSSAIIWNTMECLEQSSLTEIHQHCEVPMFSIGPMHKITPTLSSSLLKEDASCLTWLDRQSHNSVLYVSMGSIALMNERELAEMAWGIVNSKQPFLWVLRPGLIHRSDSTDLLPDGFKETVGERGCIVNWAPQKEVLAHRAVGGFWSHCGWNSTLESISEGIPMICRPCLGDQRVNARHLGHVWRVGLELENDLERGEIERAIRRLTVEKEGTEMRQRALKLKLKAEACIRKGGTSNNSLNELVKFILSVQRR